MENLEGLEDKNHIEDTTDFDTGEFIEQKAAWAERRVPLDELHRLHLRAKYRESEGKLWGAVLALQEALTVITYTSLTLAEQDELSHKFVTRIERLTAEVEASKSAPWPGEPENVRLTEQPARPRYLHVIAAKLGLAALQP